MKSLYALLAAALLAWSAGCGGTEDTPPAGNGNGNGTATEPGTNGTTPAENEDGNPSAVEEEPVESNELPNP